MDGTRLSLWHTLPLGMRCPFVSVALLFAARHLRRREEELNSHGKRHNEKVIACAVSSSH